MLHARALAAAGALRCVWLCRWRFLPLGTWRSSVLFWRLSDSGLCQRSSHFWLSLGFGWVLFVEACIECTFVYEKQHGSALVARHTPSIKCDDYGLRRVSPCFVALCVCGFLGVSRRVRALPAGGVHAVQDDINPDPQQLLGEHDRSLHKRCVQVRAHLGRFPRTQTVVNVKDLV